MEHYSILADQQPKCYDRGFKHSAPTLSSLSLSPSLHLCAPQAELEGHPDILLTLVSAPGSTPLDHLITHSCVQSADVAATSLSSADQRNRKIRFSAPNETFTLCHYQVSTIPVLPIRGFYQMKVQCMDMYMF